MELVFECRTKGPPKKATISSNEWPDTLADMLKLIRKMGYRPEDVAITGIEFNHHHGSSVWTVR